jgi:hypothetical protein
MDKQALAVLIPVLALCIPVFAIFFNGLAKVLKARGPEPYAVPHLQAQVDELRENLEQVRRELGDVNERLDFTERLLTKERERDRLPGPSR